MKLIKRILPISFFLPTLVFAATVNVETFFVASINKVGDLVATLFPVIFALAMLFFFWGVFVYFIYGAGDEEKRNTGKQFMIYSILGLVILLSVWGIVNIIQSLFGISGTADPDSIPGVPIKR